MVKLHGVFVSHSESSACSPRSDFTRSKTGTAEQSLRHSCKPPIKRRGITLNFVTRPLSGAGQGVSACLRASPRGSDYILGALCAFWRIVSEDSRYFGTGFLFMRVIMLAISSSPSFFKCRFDSMIESTSANKARFSRFVVWRVCFPKKQTSFLKFFTPLTRNSFRSP